MFLHEDEVLRQALEQLTLPRQGGNIDAHYVQLFTDLAPSIFLRLQVWGFWALVRSHPALNGAQ